MIVENSFGNFVELSGEKKIGFIRIEIIINWIKIFIVDFVLG